MINKQNKKTFNNKDYKFFVVSSVTGFIISGWEYKEDAIESQHDEPAPSKVYSRRFINTLINQTI